MGTKLGFIGVLTLVLFLVSVAMAQPMSQCTSVLITMSSCLNYVGGSAPTPSASCCSALSNVVQTQPRCLCLIVNGSGGSLGVTINQTRALDMPKVCNVQTPPISRCNENGPSMSPAGSPEGSPPEGSETGSKSTPSNGGTPNVNFALFVSSMVVVFFTPAAFAIF